MTREQYTNSDLGAFSEWHRAQLCDWYRFIDIDYLGYQLVNDEYYPYVAIERIRLNDCEPKDGPAEYPLDGHKEQIYRTVAQHLSIPAYTLWHSDECNSFALKRIDEKEEIRTFRGSQRFMSFLDELCRKQFDDLSYR